MEGHETVGAKDGFHGLARAELRDIVLLDVNMPAWMGLRCRCLRRAPGLPHHFSYRARVMLTSWTGFAAGRGRLRARPFSEVLGRRVAAHLARENCVREQGSSVKFFERLTIDYGMRTVEVRGDRGEAVPVELTRTEFDIIALLEQKALKGV